jgi:hypothetical protein
MAFAFLCAVMPAWAATATNLVDLAFGSFALMDNDIPQTIVVTPAGNATYGARVVEGPTPPQAAEFLLEDMTPDTVLTVTIDDTTLSRVDGGSPAFTISDYITNNPTTDSSGDATLLVGATLTTSGNGMHYESGHYTGTMDITIIF